ncbi:MAG: hypothetical protein ABR499_01885 [Gemmatimonadaceae bacterium]
MAPDGRGGLGERAIELYAAVNFLVIGLSHLLQPRAWVDFFVWLRTKGHTGVFLNGMLSLAFGSIIVAFHNVWAGLEAAAISAFHMMFGAAMAPRPHAGVLRVATLQFGHPYAVIAVATDREQSDRTAHLGPWGQMPVCAECNQHFAQTIDLAVSRQSAEGLERYRWGVKKPSEIAKLRQDAMKLVAECEGDFAGASFGLMPDEAKSVLVGSFLPAVAMRRADDEGFVHFTDAQVRDGSWRQHPVDWRQGVKFFGDDAAIDRLIGMLNEQGVNVKKSRPRATTWSSCASAACPTSSPARAIST